MKLRYRPVIIGSIAFDAISMKMCRKTEKYGDSIAYNVHQTQKKTFENNKRYPRL